MEGETNVSGILTYTLICMKVFEAGYLDGIEFLSLGGEKNSFLLLMQEKGDSCDFVRRMIYRVDACLTLDSN